MDKTTVKEEREVVYEGPGPAAGKSSTPAALFHGEPLRAMEKFKESVKILNSTAVSKTVSLIERLQEKLQISPLMAATTVREKEEASYTGMVPVAGKSSTLETLLHKEPLRTLEKLKETELKETKSKKSVKILNSTAVFKPLLSGAKLQPVSTGFKGLIYVERPGQFTPEQEEKQGLVGRKQNSPGVPYPDAKKSAPTLNYTNSIQNTLENIKQTVSGVEKKVEEEITVIKKSYSDGSGISDSGKGIPPGMTSNINQLSDQVYRMLEKRIKFERQRRGW
jgi:hypothetical protein